MRKTIAILAVFLIATLPIKAQVVDKKAEGIMETVSKTNQAYKNISIDFTYIMENAKNNLKESKNGKIIIAGSKYKLSMAGQVVVCDGKTIWTYIPDAEEIQINSHDPENQDAINPSTLLTTYDKNFKPKLIKEVTLKGKKAHVIDLVPLKGKSFFKVRLYINKSNYHVMRAIVYEKNGTNFTYAVNTFIPNKNVQPSTFTFDPKKYPDADVIDMR